MKNNRKTSILPNIFGHNSFFSQVTPIFYLIFRFIDKFYITYLFFFKKWVVQLANIGLNARKTAFTTFSNTKDAPLPISCNFLFSLVTPIFFYRFGFSEKFYLIYLIFKNIVCLDFTQLSIL